MASKPSLLDEFEASRKAVAPVAKTRSLLDEFEASRSQPEADTAWHSGQLPGHIKETYPIADQLVFGPMFPKIAGDAMKNFEAMGGDVVLPFVKPAVQGGMMALKGLVSTLDFFDPDLKKSKEAVERVNSGLQTGQYAFANATTALVRSVRYADPEYAKRAALEGRSFGKDALDIPVGFAAGMTTGIGDLFGRDLEREGRRPGYFKDALEEAGVHGPASTIGGLLFDIASPVMPLKFSAVLKLGTLAKLAHDAEVAAKLRGEAIDWEKQAEGGWKLAKEVVEAKKAGKDLTPSKSFVESVVKKHRSLITVNTPSGFHWMKVPTRQRNVYTLSQSGQEAARSAELNEFLPGTRNLVDEIRNAGADAKVEDVEEVVRRLNDYYGPENLAKIKPVVSGKFADRHIRIWLPLARYDNASGIHFSTTPGLDVVDQSLARGLSKVVRGAQSYNPEDTSLFGRLRQGMAKNIESTARTFNNRYGHVDENGSIVTPYVTDELARIRSNTADYGRYEEAKMAKLANEFEKHPSDPTQPITKAMAAMEEAGLAEKPGWNIGYRLLKKLSSYQIMSRATNENLVRTIEGSHKALIGDMTEADRHLMDAVGAVTKEDLAKAAVDERFNETPEQFAAGNLGTFHRIVANLAKTIAKHDAYIASGIRALEAARAEPVRNVKLEKRLIKELMEFQVSRDLRNAEYRKAMNVDYYPQIHDVKTGAMSRHLPGGTSLATGPHSRVSIEDGHVVAIDGDPIPRQPRANMRKMLAEQSDQAQKLADMLLAKRQEAMKIAEAAQGATGKVAADAQALLERKTQEITDLAAQAGEAQAQTTMLQNRVANAEEIDKGLQEIAKKMDERDAVFVDAKEALQKLYPELDEPAISLPGVGKFVDELPEAEKLAWEGKTVRQYFEEAYPNRKTRVDRIEKFVDLKRRQLEKFDEGGIVDLQDARNIKHIVDGPTGVPSVIARAKVGVSPRPMTKEGLPVPKPDGPDILPTKFHEVGNLQRGVPEERMLELQRVQGSQIHGYLAEHVGDLLHRMNEVATEADAGYLAVGEKIKKALNQLRTNYHLGISGEVSEQFVSNAKFRGIDVEELKKMQVDAGEAYAKAHESLPVFNEAQRLAQEASVAIGRMDWVQAEKSLAKLDDIHSRGRKAWKSFAREGPPPPRVAEYVDPYEVIMPAVKGMDARYPVMKDAPKSEPSVHFGELPDNQVGLAGVREVPLKEVNSVHSGPFQKELDDMVAGKAKAPTLVLSGGKVYAHGDEDRRLIEAARSLGKENVPAHLIVEFDGPIVKRVAEEVPNPIPPTAEEFAANAAAGGSQVDLALRNLIDPKTGALPGQRIITDETIHPHSAIAISQQELQARASVYWDKVLANKGMAKAMADELARDMIRLSPQDWDKVKMFRTVMAGLLSTETGRGEIVKYLAEYFPHINKAMLKGNNRPYYVLMANMGAVSVEQAGYGMTRKLNPESVFDISKDMKFATWGARAMMMRGQMSIMSDVANRYHHEVLSTFGITGQQLMDGLAADGVFIKGPEQAIRMFNSRFLMERLGTPRDLLDRIEASEKALNYMGIYNVGNIGAKTGEYGTFVALDKMAKLGEVNWTAGAELASLSPAARIKAIAENRDRYKLDMPDKLAREIFGFKGHKPTTEELAAVLAMTPAEIKKASKDVRRELIEHMKFLETTTPRMEAVMSTDTINKIAREHEEWIAQGKQPPADLGNIINILLDRATANTAVGKAGLINVSPENLASLMQLSDHGKEFYLLPKVVKNDLDGVYSNIVDFGQDLNRFMNGVRAFNNGWKSITLAIFPEFHIRNGMTNVYVNHFLAGMEDFTLYAKAQDVQRGKAGIMVNDANRVYDYEQIRIGAERHGVVNTGWNYAEFEDQHAQATRAIAGLPARMFNPVHWGRVAGTAIENNAKLALYMHFLQKGFTEESAALQVKKYLFDYADLTDFERKWLKHWIPFYTWTRKNLPLQIEAIIKNPQLMGHPVKLNNAVRDLLAGGQPIDSKAERLLPPFQRARYPTIYKDGEGIWRIHTNLGSFNSTTDLFNLIFTVGQEGGGGLARWGASQGTPIATELMEQAFNTDFGFGEQITKYPSQGLFGYEQSVGTYVKPTDLTRRQAVGKRKISFYRNLRILTKINQWHKEAGVDPNFTAFDKAAVILGLKDQAIDLEATQDINIGKIEAQLNLLESVHKSGNKWVYGNNNQEIPEKRYLEMEQEREMLKAVLDMVKSINVPTNEGDVGIPEVPLQQGRE